MKKAVKTLFVLLLTVALLLSMFLSSGIAFAKESNTLESFTTGFEERTQKKINIDKDLMKAMASSIKIFDRRAVYIKYYNDLSTLQNTFDIFEYEYPELMQYTSNGVYGGKTLQWGNLLAATSFKYCLSKSEYRRGLAIARSAKKEVQNATQNMSDFEKEKYIYDYITKHTAYNNENSSDSTIYGVFVLHKANCVGLAKAFKYLANACGLSCVCVGGYTSKDNDAMGHTWNNIKIENQWYSVDLTTEVSAREGDNKKAPEEYDSKYLDFNNDGSENEKNFKVDNSYIYAPITISDDKEYYHVNGSYINNPDDTSIYATIAKQLSESGKSMVLCSSEDVANKVAGNVNLIQDEYYDLRYETTPVYYATRRGTLIQFSLEDNIN